MSHSDAYRTLISFLCHPKRPESLAPPHTFLSLYRVDVLPFVKSLPRVSATEPPWGWAWGGPSYQAPGPTVTVHSPGSEPARPRSFGRHMEVRPASRCSDSCCLQAKQFSSLRFLFGSSQVSCPFGGRRPEVGGSWPNGVSHIHKATKNPLSQDENLVLYYFKQAVFSLASYLTLRLRNLTHLLNSTCNAFARFTTNVGLVCRHGDSVSRTNLYIRGLSPHTTDKDLINLCSK